MSFFSPLFTRKAPPARGGDDELELLRRVAAGERAALDALYLTYQPRLARFLVRFTRRDDVIDEVVNDTFFIVWRKADEFRGASRVSTWIMGIAYRCTLAALRAHDSGPLEFGLMEELSQPGVDPQSGREEADWVAKGLARLPNEQRMTMELAYGMGLSLEEIASTMDCPVGTVKARMFHARMKLRNLLPALAGEAAEAGAGNASAA